MFNGVRRIAVLAFAAAAVLAACNNSSSTVTPAGGGGASSGGGSSSSGEIATIDVSGVGKVLEGPSGLTLYHLTAEDNGTIACTGSCVGLWPPLLAPNGQAPTSTASLPKSFGTIARPDGTTQVTYNGYPLYTYSGDTATGQANGNGISGIPSGMWYAVTPTGDASSGASTKSGGGGGGYGYGS